MHIFVYRTITLYRRAIQTTTGPPTNACRLSLTIKFHYTLSLCRIINRRKLLYRALRARVSCRARSEITKKSQPQLLSTNTRIHTYTYARACIYNFASGCLPACNENNIVTRFSPEKNFLISRASRCFARDDDSQLDATRSH